MNILNAIQGIRYLMPVDLALQVKKSKKCYCVVI